MDSKAEKDQVEARSIAVKAIKDFILYQLPVIPKTSRIAGIDRFVAEKISMLDLRKLEQKIISNPKFKPISIASAAICNDNETHFIQFANSGIEVDSHNTSINNAKPDKKLIEGIREVLAHGSQHEKAQMIDNLFSRQRVKEIHRLQMFSKEFSR